MRKLCFNDEDIKKMEQSVFRTFDFSIQEREPSVVIDEMILFVDAFFQPRFVACVAEVRKKKVQRERAPAPSTPDLCLTCVW